MLLKLLIRERDMVLMEKSLVIGIQDCIVGLLKILLIVRYKNIKIS